MAEPISLEEAKLQCRIVNDDSENALLTKYIAAAREWVENYTGRALVQRSFTEYRDCFGDYIEISVRPLVSVESVDYVDTDGAEQAYADFVGVLDRSPARIYPEHGGSWPSIAGYGGVTVTYTAGYAEGEVPLALQQAMLVMVGHFYKHREAVAAGTVNQVPLAATALCDPLRVPAL